MHKKKNSIEKGLHTKKTLKTPYEPDDFIGHAAGTGPMSIVTHG